MQISTKRLWSVLATFAVALSALVLAAPAMPARTAGTTIVIWADKDRVAAVTKVAEDWASSRGVTVKIVEKTFGDIKDNLKTVAAADAPDVIVGAHDWTGELAANGLVVPLFPKRATITQFPSYTLRAFSYGTAVKNLYGAPVAVENIGLVVNTKLAKVPTTFKQLESSALAFKKKKSGNLAIAVQQGANGDAYHMYPFFSGLGGYIFGTNKAGNLNAADLGVANKTFIKNAGLIDKWNKEGLINAKVDASTAQNAFLKGQAAYWITGPWNIDAIKKAGISFRVIQVPAIAKPAVPFLGVQGFLVTKYAATHGNDAAAKDLVASYMMTPAAQQVLAAANQRYPANVQAGKKVSDPYLAQFGKAGKGGVPMPNIPQMQSVWQDLGAAWAKSTKGAGATKAAVAFRTAARNIADKIG
jgi:arabinogalactan oligomer / maltooligosaccharide transport system substrate-binding protein